MVWHDPDAEFTQAMGELELPGVEVIPAEYEVFVADAAYAPVTDVARIVADKTSDSSQERTVRVGFCLRTGFSPESDREYPLLARNAQTGEVAELAAMRM